MKPFLILLKYLLLPDTFEHFSRSRSMRLDRLRIFRSVHTIRPDRLAILRFNFAIDNVSELK